MAYRIHVIKQAGCACVRFPGDVVPEHIVDVLKQLAKSSDFEHGMNLLFHGGNHRRHGGYQASKAIFHRVKALYQKLGTSKLAMVADDAATYALHRQVELIAADDRPEKRAFDNMAEARAWLGIAPDIDIDPPDENQV